MPYEIPACAGKPYRPSNGSEGDMFRHAFCDRCIHERDYDPESGAGGCEILGRSLFHDIGDPEYPGEWTHDDKGRPTCTAFEPITDKETP